MVLRFLLVAIALLANSDSASDDTAEGIQCDIWSPTNSLPDSITQIRLGMSYSEVVKILGEPDYSPVEGQYYHSTGGYCTNDGGPVAACGFVLEYRTIEYGGSEGISVTVPDNKEEYRLQGCSWGGIAE